MYAVSTATYWGAFSYLYGTSTTGFFYMYNTNISGNYICTTASGYNGIFSYVYNYSFVVSNWSVNIYLQGTNSY